MASLRKEVGLLSLIYF